jgi:hypothetical protein
VHVGLAAAADIDHLAAGGEGQTQPGVRQIDAAGFGERLRVEHDDCRRVVAAVEDQQPALIE